MEDSVAKDESSASGRSASRLLRYPLRSATKAKEEKPPLGDSSNSAASKRERLASSVSKSVSVLNLSGKEKSSSGKPPRRFSIPSKPNASPASRSLGNITPNSEARGKNPAGNHVFDVSKSSVRKKFSVLSSASYWLSQINLSESAKKHEISLGFFKLALESGCEPLNRMRDELKSYVSRHDLSELEEPVKELFQSYKISDSFDQLQASGTSSEEPVEGSQVAESDDDARSFCSSVTDSDKMKPANTEENSQVQKIGEEPVQKNDDSMKKIRRSVTGNKAISKPVPEVSRSTQKKTQKPTKQESAKDMEKRKQGAKSARGGALNSPPVEALQENKENKDAPEMEEITST